MKKYNIQKAVKTIRKQVGDRQFETIIVCGSGISIRNLISNPIEISYESLDMPKTVVEGHNRAFIFGEYEGKNVVVFSRYHSYEVDDLKLLMIPYEILKNLGAKTVIMQTSSAGINKNYKVGDIILIEGHINFSGNNPLIGLPVKFIDMSNDYDEEYQSLIKKLSKDNDWGIKTGVHIQFSGPNYETKEEVFLAKNMGADTISMSLVYDNLIAKYLDMRVIGFAVVTNVPRKPNEQNIALTHKEVLDVAKTASSKLETIIKTILINI